ncbi:hypothetical protein [Enterovibrio calviensis]|uniref:hypothetical protein n=1 Tax=Enterovibrio calviensis TaxID=91359 RepID=UPI0006840D8E|nr:hypothetical protein [Enterovibrio calviensis]
MSKRLILSSFALSFATLMTPTVNAECLGNVYSINGGRGDVGFFLDIKETDRLTGYADAKERAIINSRAAFSSSAMAYEPTLNRTYYVSVIRPSKYYVEDAESYVSSDDFKKLPLHASGSLTNQLAYYDHDSQLHTVVGAVPDTLRMTFDPSSGQLIASSSSEIFNIDPDTAAISNEQQISNNVRFSGFSSWGDFVFKDNELLYVTNTRTFVVNPTNGSMTLKSLHKINLITAATLDQNGQILVAAKNQNVGGNVNSTHLVRIDPNTGEHEQVGLFPAKIDAMATNTQETHTCYEPTIFASAQETSVRRVNNPSVDEGKSANVRVFLSNQTRLSATANISLINDTTLDNDYSRDVSILFSDGSSTQVTLTVDGTDVSVPAGVTLFDVSIDTNNDVRREDDEVAILKASLLEDGSDEKSGTLTIKDNDEDAPESICGEYSRVSATIYDRTFYIDCDKGIVGGPELTAALDVDKEIKWETFTKGEGISKDNRTTFGTTLTNDLSFVVYQNEQANYFSPPYCNNVTDPMGFESFLMHAVFDKKSTGELICSVLVRETRCDGNGGTLPQFYDASSECIYE